MAAPSENAEGEEGIELTRLAMLLESWCGRMARDWTRNLSRHLTCRGGSSFMGWRRTGESESISSKDSLAVSRNKPPLVSHSARVIHNGERLHTLHLKRLASLNAARVGPDAVSEDILT